jgi:hypothetical protein
MRPDQTYASHHHPEALVLAVSLELAAASWKVALHDGRREKPAVHTVAQLQAPARLQAVLDLIEAHQQKWSLPAGVRVVVSYEAGQDAFWICRALQAQHVECYAVDPASIPVQRHKRRAKTDRLDAIRLVMNLRAWLRGERDRMHVAYGWGTSPTQAPTWRRLLNSRQKSSSARRAAPTSPMPFRRARSSLRLRAVPRARLARLLQRRELLPGERQPFALAQQPLPQFRRQRRAVVTPHLVSGEPADARDARLQTARGHRGHAPE